MSTTSRRVLIHAGVRADPPSIDSHTPWIKAARSSDGGNCVELRRSRGAVEVRDSKDPSGPVLRLAGAGLAAWLDSARGGDLDHLLS